MRLFLALDVDEAVRAAAAAWTSALRRHLGAEAAALRVPRLDALHVTLHFLGEVSAASDAALRTALSAPLQRPRFEAALGEAGTFPPQGAPRVIWAGLGAGAAETIAVHDALRPRLQTAGALPAFEPRGYVPHLTLARLRPRSIHRGALSRALAAVPPPQARWTIDHVTLYESDLSGNRARYTVRATTPLDRV